MHIHRTLKLTLVTATLLAGLVACGGSETTEGPAEGTTAERAVKSSCHSIDDLSECDNNFEGAYMMGESFVKDLCETAEGRFKPGEACPNEGVVGSCDDGAGTTTLYYSKGARAYTAETAKSDCASLEGTFQAAG